MLNLFKPRSEAGSDEGFMPWSDEYKIGIDSVDEDHQNLFNAANELYEAVRRREGHKTVMMTFNILTNYIHEHFAREEELMARAGYSGLAAHKQLHASFIQAFFSTKQSYMAAPKIFDFNGFLEFLRKWLVHHVLEEDKKYAPDVLEMED